MSQSKTCIKLIKTNEENKLVVVKNKWYLKVNGVNKATVLAMVSKKFKSKPSRY